MRAFATAGAILSAVLLGTLPAAADATKSPKVKRGEYLAAIMDCTGCHTPGTMLGKPDFTRYLGGSDVGFEIPDLGVFYPPNLTPDPETGLGNWSEADIIAAVRTGVRPDGRQLVPVMPYHSYGKLSDADAAALATYLKSLKPIRNRAPENTGASERSVAPYLRVVFPN